MELTGFNDVTDVHMDVIVTQYKHGRGHFKTIRVIHVDTMKVCTYVRYRCFDCTCGYSEHQMFRMPRETRGDI